MLVHFETESHFVAHTGLGSQDILKTHSDPPALASPVLRTENVYVHCRLVLLDCKLAKRAFKQSQLPLGICFPWPRSLLPVWVNECGHRFCLRLRENTGDRGHLPCPPGAHRIGEPECGSIVSTMAVMVGTKPSTCIPNRTCTGFCMLHLCK